MTYKKLSGMKKLTAVAALVFGVSSMTMSAANAEVIYYFSKAGLYNGGSITDPNLFATASFTNVTGGVQLVMSVLPGLDAHAYVNDWGFKVSSGTISSVVNTDPPAATDITVYTSGNPVLKLGGDGGGVFNLVFNFNPQNPGQIEISEASTYLISGTGLTESSFANNLAVSSAVHVQGYGDSSFYKGVTQPPVVNPGGEKVPEPGTTAILGLGLLGMGFVSLRNRKKQS
jgi:hypothetical protein